MPSLATSRFLVPPSAARGPRQDTGCEIQRGPALGFAPLSPCPAILGLERAPGASPIEAEALIGLAKFLRCHLFGTTRVSLQQTSSVQAARALDSNLWASFSSRPLNYHSPRARSYCVASRGFIPFLLNGANLPPWLSKEGSIRTGPTSAAGLCGEGTKVIVPPARQQHGGMSRSVPWSYAGTRLAHPLP